MPAKEWTEEEIEELKREKALSFFEGEYDHDSDDENYDDEEEDSENEYETND